MKKWFISLFAGVMAACLCFAVPVQAESSSFNGSSSFDGNRIASDFDNKTIADMVTGLQPGDDVSFTVTYRNDYSESTDWYMSNEIRQTLEKTLASAKVIEGTGAPENGAYTYELIHVNKDGKSEVLFSNDTVGGDNDVVIGGKDEEGLEAATNALEEYFYIDTLKQGESGYVVLNVAFEGETEVNDYMDTNGGLAVKFAVELTATESDRTRRPYTSDEPAHLGWYALMLGSSAFLFVLAFYSMMENRKEKAGGTK